MPLAPIDRGVRLVSATGQCDYDDDPSMPFRVEVVLRRPEFMSVTWALLYGGSEIVVARAESVEWARDFIKRNGLDRHPRFRRSSIAGPDGFIELAEEQAGE